jgi:hypothetical protein
MTNGETHDISLSWTSCEEAMKRKFSGAVATVKDEVVLARTTQPGRKDARLGEVAPRIISGLHMKSAALQLAKYSNAGDCFWGGCTQFMTLLVKVNISKACSVRVCSTTSKDLLCWGNNYACIIEPKFGDTVCPAPISSCGRAAVESELHLYRTVRYGTYCYVESRSSSHKVICKLSI